MKKSIVDADEKRQVERKLKEAEEKSESLAVCAFLNLRPDM